MRWLNDVPLGLIQAYQAMYSRLVAREQLQTLTVLMLAQGDSRKPDWKRLLNELERTAAGPGHRKRVSRIESEAQLAAAGFPIIRVQPDG